MTVQLDVNHLYQGVTTSKAQNDRFELYMKQGVKSGYSLVRSSSTLAVNTAAPWSRSILISPEGVLISTSEAFITTIDLTPYEINGDYVAYCRLQWVADNTLQPTFGVCAVGATTAYDTVLGGITYNGSWGTPWSSNEYMIESDYEGRDWPIQDIGSKEGVKMLMTCNFENLRGVTHVDGGVGPGNMLTNAGTRFIYGSTTIPNGFTPYIRDELKELFLQLTVLAQLGSAPVTGETIGFAIAFDIRRRGAERERAATLLKLKTYTILSTDLASYYVELFSDEDLSELLDLIGNNEVQAGDVLDFSMRRTGAGTSLDNIYISKVQFEYIRNRLGHTVT